jgi:hypothetical protein
MRKAKQVRVKKWALQSSPEDSLREECSSKGKGFDPPRLGVLVLGLDSYYIILARFGSLVAICLRVSLLSLE